jgi:predicted nucleotidyltransferase
MSTPALTGESPPIEITPRDWADVVRILHEQVPFLEVWAFGSRAKRSAKPYSDLDLALITRQPLSLGQLAEIADAFATSDLSIRVDVIDWAATSATFRKLIEQDKVVVQVAIA